MTHVVLKKHLPRDVEVQTECLIQPQVHLHHLNAEDSVLLYVSRCENCQHLLRDKKHCFLGAKTNSSTVSSLATSTSTKRSRNCSACFTNGVMMPMDFGLISLRYNLTVIRKTFKNEINVIKY
ncbi:hypothetical protein GQX74_009530 [Glossina fuscipes]|nr:hypothetical protein GQX74_009530 [Glossina fuscipes]